MELGLKDKVAVITGGSEGLGRAAAERLAQEGARVAILARRPEVLAAAADGIARTTGQQPLAHAGDVTDEANCRAFIDAVLARWGRIDILLNNAGSAQATGFEAVDDALWHADWNLKVMGAVRMTRLVVPSMRANRDGRIVNITTVNGKAPRAGGLPTSVSRAAGINLTKSLANEYAACNIRVNTICIGLVRSAQIDRWNTTGDDLDAHYARLAAERVPLGRVASAGEFADLFAFLVSDRARYVTGTAINFDGGAGMTV